MVLGTRHTVADKIQHGSYSHSAYGLAQSNFVSSDTAAIISPLNMMMWVAVCFDRHVFNWCKYPPIFNLQGDFIILKS